jgi:hypothetical protein
MNKYEELVSLVKRMFFYLDIKESTDEGKIFSPNVIRSCRASDGIELDKTLARMKDLVYDAYPRLSNRTSK